MFREFMGIIGEAAADMIDAYTEITNERAELIESIRKYNERAALYGLKPITVVEADTSSSNEEMTKLKKYFSEKTYSSQYKAESDLNGFGFKRISGSTWKRGNTIASIEFFADHYGYIIKLF